MHQPLSIEDVAAVIADSVAREVAGIGDEVAALAKEVSDLRSRLAAVSAERDNARATEPVRFRAAAVEILTGDEVAASIRSAVADAVSALPAPAPGRDADPQEVADRLTPVVVETVRSAVAAIKESAPPLPDVPTVSDIEQIVSRMIDDRKPPESMMIELASREMTDRLGETIMPQITEEISRSGDDIEARIRASVEVPDIRGLVDAAVAEAIAALPEPQPGRDASAAEVAEAMAPMVAETVRSAVEAFRPDWSGVADIVRAAASAEPPPTPEVVKGWIAADLMGITDTLRASMADDIVQEVSRAIGEMDPAATVLAPDPEGLRATIVAEVEKRVAELPPPPAGLPGRDADPAEVAEIAGAMIRESLPDLISRAVGTAIAELPPGAFPAGPQGPEGPAGKDIAIEDVMPTIDRLIRNAVTEPLAAAVEAVKSAATPGQDGVSIKDAAIGQAGDLVLTLSDGTILKPGIVVGRSVSDEDVRQMVADAAAALPKARDGFGFDDLSADFDGDRTVTLRFARGEDEKVFAIPLPIPVYRGVWKAGTFRRGDTVTFGGNLWIAKQDTEGRPGGDATWQLAVKRGRDGQDTVRVPRDPNKPVSVKP